MMSSTLLEQTRFRHEEVERLEGLVVDELRKTEPASPMERLVQGHRVRNMIHSIRLKTEKLVETYENKDVRMEAEIAKLSEIDLFYDCLKEIREYHRKFDASEDYIALVTKEEPVVAFSREEGFEKKQGLMYTEMGEECERDQEARATILESGVDDDKDGQKLKPIQHWLKNLHGLRKEFKCEICGNKTYKKRSFEMHFKGPQHQRGMRLLGFPSTNSFNEFITIDEAGELWRRIKKQGLCIWRPKLEV